MESFDELFEKFFGGRINKKNPFFDNDDLGESFFANMPMDMNHLMDMMNFEEITPEDNQNMEEDLGEPDKSESFEEDGTTYNKDTWETEHGSLTRVTISGELPMDGEFDFGKMLDALKQKMGGVKLETNLEDQLKEAEEVEDYELCVKLRDEIKKRDNEDFKNIMDKIEEETKAQYRDKQDDTEDKSGGDFWDDVK